jgi:hypothetical protein
MFVCGFHNIYCLNKFTQNTLVVICFRMLGNISTPQNVLYKPKSNLYSFRPFFRLTCIFNHLTALLGIPPLFARSFPPFANSFPHFADPFPVFFDSFPVFFDSFPPSLALSHFSLPISQLSLTLSQSSLTLSQSSLTHSQFSLALSQLGNP